MKKVLFFSCEPGGAEVIIPVAKLLASTGDFEVTVTGYGYAIERFERQSLPYTHIEKIEKDDLLFLQRFSPDLVITSATSIPSRDMSEKHLWHLARNAGIKSIAFLDQWQNYSIRFSGVTAQEKLAYMPDVINCIDEIGKREMLAEGFDGSILYPLGQPYLDQLNLIADKLNSAAIRNTLNLGQHEEIILFVSEALQEHYGRERGYTQYDALQIFLKGVAPVKTRSILIKLHPKDDINKFKQIQAAFPQHKLLFISNELTPLECIVISNKVFGMSSIMLIEAYIIGKSVASMQPSLKVADPLVLSRYGYIPLVTDEDFNMDEFDALSLDQAQESYKTLQYKFLKAEFLSLTNKLLP